MSFDTIAFLSCFLPLFTLLYYVVRSDRFRNALLLLGGLLFYSFGQIAAVLFLLALALINYVFGLLLIHRKAPNAICAFAVLLNVAFLAAFKYFLPVVNTILPDKLLSPPLWLSAAPLGISFFIFKCISYLVDVRRDPAKGTKNLFHLLLYISFFPQIIAGPIMRFPAFHEQLRGRVCDALHAASGLRRFVIGLSKKLLIAATAAKVADAVFALGADTLDLPLSWLGAVAYTLQIYFDFSGYSDMAIGLGTLYGFHTEENFLYPYAAFSVGDFWRRWHISLSSWLRDYIYIPLGGSRRGKVRAALNRMIVFLVCGLWHGAAPTFLFWGAWHGVFTAAEGLLKKQNPSFFRRVFGHVYTLLVVCIGFVFFRADNLGQGFLVLRSMFGWGHHNTSSVVLLHQLLSPETTCILFLAVLTALPWKQWIGEKYESLTIGRYRVLSYAAAFVLLLLCMSALASGTFSPFIYAQF